MGEFSRLDDFLGAGRTEIVLPTPVTPAWFDPANRAWFGEKDLSKLTKSGKKDLVQCSLVVQYSPSNRASCRRCGDKIDKDVLRLAYPFRYRESEDAYSIYLHTECYAPEVFGIKEKELRTRIFGFEALNNTERSNLWKSMRSSSRADKANSEAQAAVDEYANGCICDAPAPVVAVPKQIVVPMLPFQQEGLAWMCQQEKTGTGGVLADEMGMGKTIQAISLLLARPLRGPTLVVCPMAACHQWVKEIERFTAKNSLRTLIYHGQHKSKVATEFRRVDVVVTTYQTLENEYRSETNKQRVTCKWCGKMFLPEKLTFHQRYFCGPTAIRTLKQQKTAKKDQVAAAKAMSTMGIGESVSGSAPTITNIYKEYMKEAGVDVKAKGYWNVVKETQERLGKGSSGKKSGPGLSRERLVLLGRAEIQELCDAHGLEKTGRKAEMIDRLMDEVVRGMGTSSSSTALVPLKKEPSEVKPKTTTKAAAKVTAKAKVVPKSAAQQKTTLKPRMKLALASRSGGSSKYAGVTWNKNCNKWQASFNSTYIGVFSSELSAARAVRDRAEEGNVHDGQDDPPKKKAKGQNGSAVPRAPDAPARTVAAVRGAGKPTGKHAAATKGAKGQTSSSTGMKVQATSSSNSTVVQTFEGQQLNLSGSPLIAMQWSRVVLDEAHRIKGRTNSTAQAAYALQSGFKWCLTGTPLQNRVGELYSLVRFLRVRPFAFYYCKIKGCGCECAKFMRERYCANCGHVRFQHYSYFKNKISNPIVKFGYMGAGKAAFGTLRNDLLNKIMLRRTKDQRKADLQLPDFSVVIRKDELSQQEKDFYESLYRQSCINFDTYVSSGTILHNYAHIFDLLTSLRRAVDHPYLIVYGGGKDSHKLAPGASLKEAKTSVCGLCQDDILEDGEETKRAAKCGHAFHDECIRDYIKDAPALPSGGVGCPVCFAKLSIDLDDTCSDDEGTKQLKVSKASKAEVKTPRKVKTEPLETSTVKQRRPAPTRIMQHVTASEFQSSTKIEALIDEVQKMIAKDDTSKAIVFSQFGAMLELVEFQLKRQGISCVVFRGGMTMQAREDSLSAYNRDPSLKVILISLKAGGEGLNLQVADHVFLLDPWWNPACEMQAIQRAHRIGQTRQVKAVRLICSGTIEEKIVKLQEKKQLVFDASIDGSQTSMAKLTEQDLRFLFQH